MSETFAQDDLFGTASAHQGAGEDFLIVGVGASAGGIHALKEFFANVPAESGMAYVVILHLSPDYESKLAEVLQPAAAIPVTQASDRVRVEPNHIYVISPNRSLKMADGHLALSEIMRIEERRAPIDIFFRTLAESHHARAVCVVLSGSGADGSMGMKRVKENGGICIVQNPEEAEYAEMPRNSLMTGLVDYVLAVAEIPARIIAYKDHLGKISLPVETEANEELDAQALRDIFTQLRVRTGHDFSNYKRSTVLRRIERRLGVHGLQDLPAYAHHVRQHPEEMTALLKDLLISVTNFFRDPEQFAALEQSIIPKLFANKSGEDYVRVWVAGCATGEEAYSVAMLLAEFAAGFSSAPTIQVFATDIDEWAIAKAREGLYTLNDAADVSPERLRQFFVKETNGYRARRELREMVLFAAHNIIKDPPFSHLNLITCRNLLIYLNRTAQERVMQIMHFALEPAGYLFLGTSESIESGGDLFTAVDKDHHIFQGRPLQTRLKLPLPSNSPIPTSWQFRPDRSTQDARAFDRLSYLELHQRLLEQYAPPSVIINENYDIVHSSERAGRYMQVGGGEPSHNLLRLVRPELRLELRTALYQATQKRTNVEARALRVQLGDRVEHVNLLVHPVLREEAATRGFILVLFEDAGEAGSSETAAAENVTSATEPIARRLEEELMRVRSQLRSTAEQHEIQQEELKAFNEELQAMNEELHSTTEELETGKEELQSVNEELTTINQELKVKIEDLSQANSDFKNLMNSTDIGTVFLDRSLRVKLFTPRACDIFKLIPADLGRPLADINSQLIYDHMLPDIEHVIDSLQIAEREVSTRDGRWFLMRLLPYRTAEDRVNGTVLTFLDITKRKLAEEELRRSEEYLRLIIESVEFHAIFAIDAEGRIESWNAGAERIFGYTQGEALGQHTEIIFTPEDMAEGIHEDEMRRAREWGGAADERWYVRKDGSRFYASGVMTPLRNTERAGYVKVARDLTEQEAAEELYAAHEQLETRVVERTRELAGANESLQIEVAERKQSEALRLRLLRQLVSAQEDERRRIARDLHDQMGQQLTALRLKLETLKSQVMPNTVSTTQVEQVQAIAMQIEADIDFLAWELRPAALDDLGLRDTLATYVKNWSDHFDIPADFHSDGFDTERLTSEIETNLYRIAQEALNNICKHGQASHVDIILERRSQQVLLIIEDDGVGFNSNPTPSAIPGMGLIGMHERAALLGGSLEIESTPGEGTTLFVRLPVTLAAEGEA